MDKERMRKLLTEANQFAALLENDFPKARNRVNSLRWNLKSALEELDKTDPAPVAVPATPESPK